MALNLFIILPLFTDYVFSFFQHFQTQIIHLGVSLLLVVLVVIAESKDEEDSSAGFSGLLKTDAPNQTKPANERNVGIYRESGKRGRDHV